MSSQSPIFTPDLIKIVKIFLLSGLGMVLLFSFFDGYRANNTGEDRSFRTTDADRLYFLNLRSVHYDREIRSEAGMVIFRHGKRPSTTHTATFFPALLLNAKKEDAYVFFELEGANYPLHIRVMDQGKHSQFTFDLSGNLAHKALANQLWGFLQREAALYWTIDGTEVPLWNSPSEKEVLKTVLTDYFRLLNQPH